MVGKTKTPQEEGMKKMVLFTLALTILLSLFILGCGQGKESAKTTGFTETAFSATMLLTPEGAQEPAPSKFYKDGDKLRIQPLPSGIITITRKDKNLVWIINPENKTYVEQLYSEAKIRVSEIYLSGQRVKIGEETIDGHPCIKYEFTPTNQPEVKTIEWQAKDLRNFPIRLEGYYKNHKGKSVKALTQHKDIDFNKPAAELFELPKNAKRVATLAEVGGAKMPVAPQNSTARKKGF